MKPYNKPSIKTLPGTNSSIEVFTNLDSSENIDAGVVNDFGEEWKKFTGLPFVFAVWVSNQKLNSSYIQQFNQCFEKGISHISEITDNYKFLSKQIAFDYLTKNISYNFDERKKEALGLFQNYVKLLMPSTKLNSINA